MAVETKKQAPSAKKQSERLAVIMTGGKQYVVREGDTLKVEKLDVEAGKTATLENVLLVADGDTVTLGMPNVPKSSVTVDVIEHARAPKIVIQKFKSKTRFSKKAGHRQPYTKIQITNIK